MCPGHAAARFHGHAHHEPPHFAYRGDGLPPIACEQIQQMVHMNERMAQGKLASMRPSSTPLREAECNVEGHRIELYEDLKELHDTIMAANWHDSILLTMNGDLWDGTLARLKRMAEDVSDMQVQVMLSKTLEIFDALYKVEDVQDHIFELIEELPHFGGKPATESPLAAGNIDKHINHVLERYAQLKQEHPRYTAKIQDSVGYSLAILRQRYTFSWPEEHKYFY
ncbi:hypothetical protein, conserved [Babesia ovata]|uniref:DUF6827 domain-containing protein n=1 Tax=Babesia ovata TaxID=189622 RepID=A0A2H6KCN8_9APIC|nr:uncharacterized protein BOVATA_022560 [Babesia ovata]GBE60763.1 hypothetical protein, conserved [Babesia ovata]